MDQRRFNANDLRCQGHEGVSTADSGDQSNFYVGSKALCQRCLFTSDETRVVVVNDYCKQLRPYENEGIT